MGMAGGAYKGDMERARQAMQAAQLAANSRAQASREAQAQAQLDEQARQADLAHERGMRALDLQAERQEAAMAQQEVPERRSPHSAFSNADMLAAARRRAQDERLATLAGQNSVFGQMQEIVGVEKRQQAAKRAQGQATMASLMKIASVNGGTAPMSALNYANRQFGFDGKTRAIGAAGFTANGDWFVDFIQKDQNGQISRHTSTMPFADQGRIYYSQAGIFDNADRAAWRKGMLDQKYSTQEVNTRSGLDATMIEALDDAGRQRLDAGFVDPSYAGDWKRDLAYRKQALAEAKFAQALGQKSLDAAQKYALYHFNEFGGARKATDADVQNGLAKKVGDMFMPTPRMMFNDAVKFYKDNMGGEDPATSAEGRDPAVVSTQGGDNGNPPPANDGQPPANGQPSDGNEKWDYETYKWNPKHNKIDSGNIKGTGISFTESDRLKVPAGREKEFEAYMDGIAALHNPYDHEEGKKIIGKDPSRPSSELVPKDWREKIGKGDFDRDYDFVAAFLEGVEPGVNPEDGAWHMGDVGKLPTHPVFSNESYYARNPKYAPLAGRWKGETYIPGEAERNVNYDEKDGSAPQPTDQPEQPGADDAGIPPIQADEVQPPAPPENAQGELDLFGDPAAGGEPAPVAEGGEGGGGATPPPPQEGSAEEDSAGGMASGIVKSEEELQRERKRQKWAKRRRR